MTSTALQGSARGVHRNVRATPHTQQELLQGHGFSFMPRLLCRSTYSTQPDPTRVRENDWQLTLKRKSRAAAPLPHKAAGGGPEAPQRTFFDVRSNPVAPFQDSACLDKLLPSFIPEPVGLSLLGSSLPRLSTIGCLSLLRVKFYQRE